MSDDGRYVYVSVIYITLIIRERLHHISNHYTLVYNNARNVRDGIAVIVDYVDCYVGPSMLRARMKERKKKEKKTSTTLTR